MSFLKKSHWAKRYHRDGKEVVFCSRCGYEPDREKAKCIDDAESPDVDVFVLTRRCPECGALLQWSKYSVLIPLDDTDG